MAADKDDEEISLTDLVSSAPAAQPKSSSDAQVSAPAKHETAKEAQEGTEDVVQEVVDLALLDGCLYACEFGFLPRILEITSKDIGIQVEFEAPSLEFEEAMEAIDPGQNPDLVAVAKGVKGVIQKVRYYGGAPFRRTFDIINNVLGIFLGYTAFIRSHGKVWLGHGLSKSKQYLLSTVGYTKQTAQNLWHIPRRKKLIALAVLVLATAAGGTLRLIWRQHFLPRFESPYLYSFIKVSDHIYPYKAEDPMESFFNPLRHPEYVVALDKVVVNLKRKSPDDNPMAMIEFFIEGDSRELAVEVIDRHTEALHTVSRVVEQISYDELDTIEGKNKLKLVVRRELNNVFSKGRIVRVYFKTIILKP